jgi:Holliday junction resolvasome RuvABC DNA-binding subunit
LKDRASKVLDREEISPPQIPEEEDRRLIDDALSALLNLGYSAKLAKQAIEKAQSAVTEITLEGLIREALRILA